MSASVLKDPKDPTWQLSPGDTVERADLHRRLGGSTRGGVAPSSQTPNVFLFTDAEVGVKHGYEDGWQDDGCFHYTGTGQEGDQTLAGYNGSVLRHSKLGNPIHLFSKVGGKNRYLDAFSLDPVRPVYETDAVESGSDRYRSVVVFRLRPFSISPGPTRGEIQILPTLIVDEVAPEEHLTERMLVEPTRLPYTAEKREADLVKKFKKKYPHVKRLKITPPGEAKPIFSDLWVADQGWLIEAKGSIERNSIRMAIGQLADYARFKEVRKRSVLVPARPRSDLVELILSVGASVIWPEGKTFRLIDQHGEGAVWV